MEKSRIVFPAAGFAVIYIF